MPASVEICIQYGFVEGNAVQAHLAVLTAMMNVALINALKKHEEEMRNGNGWKWNDYGLRMLTIVFCHMGNLYFQFMTN